MDNNIWEENVKGLSKSRYVAGLQCPRMLYYIVHNPTELPEPNAFDRYQMEQGTFAGKYAANFFKNAARIPEFPIDFALQKTQEAIRAGKPHIMEAAFTHENVHVKVDVLRRLDNGKFDIIEIKSKTKVEPTHWDDLAIQMYVLQQNGLEINAAYIFHLNKEYRHPDGDLFLLADQTEKVFSKLKEVPQNIKQMTEILARIEPPEQDIGPQCSRPYKCGLRDECWQHIPELSIFNIPRYRGKWDFYRQGIIELDHVPEDFIGTGSQMPFIESYRTKKPKVDKSGLNKFMGLLKEPLYFMDFETIQLAVPKYNGTKPWQQLTVQWSVHKLTGNGEPEHFEFIHTEKSDPREPFIKSLLDMLGDTGSIIVWWVPFESGRLKEIADAFPQYQPQIASVLARIWEPYEASNKYYCDWRFKGSNSLKNVLPVMVPGLSYDPLEIQEGGTAMAEYARMLGLPGGPEKQQIRQNLLEYCKLDTLAMVEIHRALEEFL